MTILPAHTARDLYQVIARLKAVCYECQIIELPADADPVDRNRLLQAMTFMDRAEQSLSDIGGLFGYTEPGNESSTDTNPLLLDQPPGIYYTAQTATGPQTRYYPTETSTADDKPVTSNDPPMMSKTGSLVPNDDKERILLIDESEPVATGKVQFQNIGPGRWGIITGTFLNDDDEIRTELSYNGLAAIADYRELVTALLTAKQSVFTGLNIRQILLVRIASDLGHSADGLNL